MTDQKTNNQTKGLEFIGQPFLNNAVEAIEPTNIAFELSAVRNCLLNLNQYIFIVRQQGKVGIIGTEQPKLASKSNSNCQILISLPPMPIENLGDTSFKKTYGMRYACFAGSMANGIASVEMVNALGKAGLMGSFGAAGMVRSQLEAAVQHIQEVLPKGPYAFNLIYNPNEEALERNSVEVYLQFGVHVVEASAYIDLTPNIIHFRAAGLNLNSSGEIQIANRIIAKVSRREVATKFMEPAADNILSQLVNERRITQQQAELASHVPVADDITVEADSGGHTDNRPLVCLLPSMLSLRDEIQAKYNYSTPIRIGAAGGISTPASALAAFIMGAAYIVTGSVNQACIESGTSEHTKQLLTQASMADVTMAPSADMFELGVKVQVLKHGTLFPMRALKFYDLYTRYDSIDHIPADEREKLEKQIFKRDLESVWQETIKFFNERDPLQIERAKNNPKRKMALIFRWYLGLSSRWSNKGEKGREMDYQIWCGPSMGSFNDWVRGTYLEEPQRRRVVDVALHLLTGVAYQYRLQSLKVHGLNIPTNLEQYHPLTPLGG